LHAGSAPVGNVPITDGAPISAQEFDAAFPYLHAYPWLAELTRCIMKSQTRMLALALFAAAGISGCG
jgi:hypothetical protein